MKRAFAVLAALCLLLGTGALADHGTAEFICFGTERNSVSLEYLRCRNGKVTVGLTFASGGLAEMSGDSYANMQIVKSLETRLVYGDEEIESNMFLTDVPTSFVYFEADTYPDAIVFYPQDPGDGPERVVLWETGDPVPFVKRALRGTWQGTGTPKGGRGNPIDLTVEVDAYGNGSYTFLQGGYSESCPILLTDEGDRFTAEIPADNTLGITQCGGTYELDSETGVLHLDITTTFADGTEYSYTAECVQPEAE